jgi:hypothetical protein
MVVRDMSLWEDMDRQGKSLVGRFRVLAAIGGGSGCGPLPVERTDVDPVPPSSYGLLYLERATMSASQEETTSIFAWSLQYGDCELGCSMHNRLLKTRDISRTRTSIVV